MGLVMATRKRPTPRNHATRKPGTKQSQKKTGKTSLGSIPVAAPSNLSYEEAVIKHILQSSPQVHKVPREALIFGSLMSNMSPAMSEMYYKSGMQVGRALYRVNAEQKDYIIPEESIEDLVKFFELIGYRNVTYSAYQDSKISIEFHEPKSSQHLGSRMHVFESGIISGYLTAAKGQLVNVAESSCTGSDGDACRFVEAPAASHGSASVNSLDELAEMVKQRSMSEQIGQTEIASEYQSLLYTPVLDVAYSDYMKQIASYLGNSVGSRIASSLPKGNGKARMQSIEQAIRTLNMGTPMVRSMKPLDIRIKFDELASRQGFVDISLSFINGLLSSSMVGKATATESIQNGHYTVDIKGSK